MSTQVFTDVLFRREDSAKDDSGTLTIESDSIQFVGRIEQLSITNIQFASIREPSGVQYGEWVKVKYSDGGQPCVVYFREQLESRAMRQIYPAIRRVAHSSQFECIIRADQYVSSKLSKGYIAVTKNDIVTLPVAQGQRQEIALYQMEGFSHKLLTAKQQINREVRALFIVSIAVGLIIAVVLLIIQKGNTTLTQADSLSNAALAFGVSLALVFVGGLLYSIPSLRRIITVDLFTLHFDDHGRFVFAVIPSQSEQVAKTLKSWGIEALP